MGGRAPPGWRCATGFAQGNLYPVSDGALKEALAARHGIEPGGIVLGNGSTDAIRMTVRAEALRSIQAGGWA